MTAKLTWAQAVAHMSGNEARLTQYLKGDTVDAHPTFDMYLPIADGIIGSRIKTRYSTAAYDAFDSATIPPYVQFYLFCVLLSSATAHDEGRPDLIEKYGGIAAGWLDDVESGKAKIAELAELASMVQGSKGHAMVRVGTGREGQHHKHSFTDELRRRTRPI